MKVIQDFIAKVSPPSAATHSDPDRRSKLWIGLILSLWLTIVLITTMHHEFCRDEVRPLSLARRADSLVDLYRLTQYDGHPFLWFLLLDVGTAIVDTSLVLPILSIALAFAAVAIFTLTAPFALWIKILVIFGALPLYEYSVMARNYGISMLLIFLVAMAYRRRDTHPMVMGILLALLANTNVHSTILAVLFTGVWIWERMLQRESGSPRAKAMRWIQALGIVLGGVVLSIIWTWPRQNTILTDVHHTFGLRPLLRASVNAVLQPRVAFLKLMPKWAGWSIGILLPLALLGLLVRPPLFLAALGGQLALGSFFQLAYWGDTRHQGLLLIFILSLYGIALDTNRLSRIGRVCLTIGLTGLLILMVGNVIKAEALIRRDINRRMSASEAFAEFLKASPTYHDAMIIPEPAYLAESLPYYVSNRIYLPREGRFGTTVSWTTAASSYMSLGQLLSAARDLADQHDQRILILYGHRARIRPVTHHFSYSYNKVFAWTPNEAATFKDATTLIADFKQAAGDETYEIYALW